MATFNWQEATAAERGKLASDIAFGMEKEERTFKHRLAYAAWEANDRMERAMRSYREASVKAQRDAQYAIENLDEGKVAAPTHARLDGEYATVMAAGENLRTIWNLFVAYLEEVEG